MKKIGTILAVVISLSVWMGTGCDSVSLANVALNAALAEPDTSGYTIVGPLVPLGSIYDN